MNAQQVLVNLSVICLFVMHLFFSVVLIVECGTNTATQIMYRIL